MTADETIDVLTMIRGLWPHSTIDHGRPGATAALWHSMLVDCDRAAVELAVREMASNGREHAPPVGVIVKAVADREVSAPEWDEALAEIERTLGKYRRPMPPGGFASERAMHGGPPASYWSSPLLAQFMGHEGVWWEWKTCPSGDRRTFLAQQREAYKALRARSERDAGLRIVRAPREPGLRRPDFAAALPKVADA